MLDFCTNFVQKTVLFPQPARYTKHMNKHTRRTNPLTETWTMINVPANLPERDRIAPHDCGTGAARA